MQASDVNQKVEQLLSQFEIGIQSAFSWVFENCRVNKKTPQEPDFIAGLVIEFTPSIFNVLQATFPKTKFSVTGVYCHQKPIVDIGLSKCPELGDILFVYRYTNQRGEQTVNSLLFQAKMSSSHIDNVASSDLHQLELYLKWPDFTYKRAGKLTGEKRSILPKAVNDGAQYLLINSNDRIARDLKFNLRNHPLLWCAKPDFQLDRNYCLSAELVDFVKFKSGRVVENDPKISNDHWTKMVWELIEIAEQKAAKRKNMGIGEFSRLNLFESDGLCAFESNSDSIFSGLHQTLSKSDGENGGFDFYDEENIGVSVVVIEGSDEGNG